MGRVVLVAEAEGALAVMTSTSALLGAFAEICPELRFVFEPFKIKVLEIS